MKTEELPVWDLSQLYKSPHDPALLADIEKIVAAAKTFEEKWRGKLAGIDADGLLAALKDYEEAHLASVAPYVYASLGYSANSEDPAILTLLHRVREKSTEAHRSTIFFTLELDAISDGKFSTLAASPKLAAYSHYLTESRKAKSHRLTEPEESILTLKALSGRTAFVQLYSKLTSAFTFPSPLEEGKTLTGSELLALVKHPDRAVRRKALETYSAAYKEAKTVISSVWNALALDHRQNTELRAYEDIMAPVDEQNELSRKAVDTVMGVTRENYPLAQRYYRWKTSALGVEKLWSSDLSAPLPEKEAEAITWEETKELVISSFADFHPSFAKIATELLDEGRVDARPRQGKSGGAFCMGAAPTLPVYVLTNFTGKLRDAATLAHELGHAVHFTLAQKQPLLEYGPVLPLAETASVFGELLLTRKLLGRKMDRASKRALLAERIEDVLATTFRQTMYTDFELEAHKLTANEFVTPETFCGLWEKRLSELYGDTVETLEATKWSWSAIPHFIHTRFYCYAYTFGELLVLALYGRYEEEGEAFAPKLIEILAAGGSKRPQELVASLGYDLEDPNFWAGGYRVLEKLIGELENT
jgi:oligoendopeptidase F